MLATPRSPRRIVPLGGVAVGDRRTDPQRRRICLVHRDGLRIVEIDNLPLDRETTRASPKRSVRTADRPLLALAAFRHTASVHRAGCRGARPSWPWAKRTTLASGPQRGGNFDLFSSHTGTRLPLNHSEPKPLKQMLFTLGSLTRVDHATNHLAAVSRNLLAIDLEATQERGGLGAIERIHPMDVESTCSAERRLTPACFNSAA